MPDRGLLTRPPQPPPTLQRGGGPWAISAARIAQLTFEVDQAAAMESMPGDVSRPVPCYARLFVLEAADSPAGPFTLAALMVGGRYRMMPRNFLVQAVVDGPAEALGAAFGGGFVPGKVSLSRTAEAVSVTIASGGHEVARLNLPAPRAIDPTMLRWDPWLTFASQGGADQIVEFGPRVSPQEAFLSKGATLETPAGLDTGDPWRRLRNLNTVSGCFVEGSLELTQPEVQQALL